MEAALLKRLERKARHYGQDESQGGSLHDMKVDPEVVVRMYRDHVIPLTKQVEVSISIDAGNSDASRRLNIF